MIFSDTEIYHFLIHIDYCPLLETVRYPQLLVLHPIILDSPFIFKVRGSFWSRMYFAVVLKFQVDMAQSLVIGSRPVGWKYSLPL